MAVVVRFGERTRARPAAQAAVAFVVSTFASAIRCYETIVGAPTGAAAKQTTFKDPWTSLIRGTVDAAVGKRVVVTHIIGCPVVRGLDTYQLE